MIHDAFCHSAYLHFASLALNSATSSALLLFALYPFDLAITSVSEKQANSLVNEGDAAFQSRYLLLQFSALKNTDDDNDPRLYDNWLAIRELLSALTPDFAMLLLDDGKLDRAAIQDCAAFLQQAIGRKRDRNANMWAVLLYFMLVINAMFQCDQGQVFEWMVKSVTRSSYELVCASPPCPPRLCLKVCLRRTEQPHVYPRAVRYLRAQDPDDAR